MPKDEFDLDDPFELNGMAFLTREDATDDMARTFIEEFVRMGYSHEQILAVFRNPLYLGPRKALEQRGEPFIRDLITEVFARRGRLLTWSATDSGGACASRAVSAAHGEQAPANDENSPLPASEGADRSSRGGCGPQEIEREGTLTDPMGVPFPELNR